MSRGAAAGIIGSGGAGVVKATGEAVECWDVGDAAENVEAAAGGENSEISSCDSWYGAIGNGCVFNGAGSGNVALLDTVGSGKMELDVEAASGAGSGKMLVEAEAARGAASGKIELDSEFAKGDVTGDSVRAVLPSCSPGLETSMVLRSLRPRTVPILRRGGPACCCPD